MKEGFMPDTLIPDSPSVADNGQPVGGAASRPALTDQEQFDATVNRDSRIVMQVLAGVAVLAALVMSTVALVLASAKSSANAPAVATTAAAVVAPVPSGAPLNVTITGSNKLGSDGKMHDSFSKTNFAVKVGQPITLRVNNTDSSPHSITSAEAGVSVILLPGVHNYTFTVQKAGHFSWLCILTCDSGAAGWAMTHPGYMAGYITAT
jgi:plastocyanin